MHDRATKWCIIVWFGCADRVRTGTLNLEFHRYVAIGDSSTEGLDDPDGQGGYRGWADRLAQHIADLQGGLDYANLGVRGLSTAQIRERQLDAALAMRPDLATLFCGTNDVLARDFDPSAFERDLEAMQGALRSQGATVVGFTLPDLTPLIPAARRIAPRIARMNAVLAAVSGRTGSRLVDFAAYPVAVDPRLWSRDRIHANSPGHARIASALAHALELPGSDDTWKLPLPAAAPRSALGFWAGEAGWWLRYALPWSLAPFASWLPSPRREPKRAALMRVEGAAGGHGEIRAALAE